MRSAYHARPEEYGSTLVLSRTIDRAYYMNARIITGVILVGIATILAIVFLLQRENTGTSASDLEKFASIELSDYEGRAVSLAAYAGKPLIVNSWAVWCPFCKQELPDFAALQAEFPDITVIAIDRAEPVDTVRAYTDGLGISGKMTFLLDSGDDFYKSIGGFSMPETIFLDAGGHITFHKRGPMTLNEMQEAVKKYLQ